MIVHVDNRSMVPVFEQLRSQIERLIVSGQLHAGTKLPPIRELANDLGLARGTVQKVYDTLSREGFVKTAGRHGTLVLDNLLGPTTATDLAAAADTLALVTRQLGLPPGAAHQALDTALLRF